MAESHPIDLQGWSRRSHYDFFRGYAWPFFDVCARVDVTALVERTRAGNGSLFAALLHAATGACNDVPQLRQRIEAQGPGGDERVVEYAAVGVSFTALADAETFNYCTVEWDADPAAFAAAVRAATQAIRGRRDLDLTADVRRDLIYMSSLPWVDFTSVQHARPLAPDDPDTVPRVMWGRVVDEGGRADARCRATFGLSVHHALVDGLHAGRFFERLQARVEGRIAGGMG